MKAYSDGFPSPTSMTFVNFMNKTWDVLVIGGGNAALCAAITAREAGASVLMLESAPRDWRGGNSVHTRNIRCMHDAPQDVLTEAYPEEEFWQDLYKVTGGITDEALARRVIRESATCRTWMRAHGVHFQPSLSGTLHLSRTNAFFMGGGKALVNAYYRSAKALGIEVRYDSPVERIELQDGRFIAAHVGSPVADPTLVSTGKAQALERITAKVCVLASGGFESNIAWQREAWGQNALGEWPAEQFAIRGTRYNMGVVLRHVIAGGADPVGDPTQAHMVAVDARAPLFDGGISTRVDSVSLGIMVNVKGERFYDEGEDFWPKRYALWGRLIALQPRQLAHSIIDAKAIGRFMPAVFRGEKADSLEDLGKTLGLPLETFLRTVREFNAACRPGQFDHSIMDNCRTEGLTPEKTHWARTIDTPPYFAYSLKPGVTFTYLGVRVDETAAVHFAGQPSANLFAAGEIMAGNVLGKGYTAGVGMTIGTVFGRIAGASAAKAAASLQDLQPSTAAVPTHSHPERSRVAA